jgi:uncharacterized Zn finger protein (UPF0148 family)
MKIRGDRECKDCGTRWSYYDTGSVTCPQCGSLRSVGVDDRKQHTASASTLDLTPIRQEIDDVPLTELADRAASACQEYVRTAGFIDAGTLLELDDTYLAATELLYVARTLDQSLRPGDEADVYLLSLLRGADLGERPSTDEVPSSMRHARGLAYASAVEDYRRDVRAYLDENPDELARDQLATIADHQKRIEALDGDVALATSEGLVRAIRALGRYLTEDDESALAAVQEHLRVLDPGP